ncbi:MAG: 23S rRNA (pseudouridine(1915)-N(3))-methyltransferase RlmH [Bacilli bacterium]|nr:23S rRNA (pseudouridine(1915)-N(3))-methyltransferase RlmH [Bacilli bacterium]
MIKIICVGKIKEKFFNEAMNEYLKRISKYVKISVIEVPDYNYDVSKTIYEEGRRILSRIDEHDFVITTQLDGKLIDSPSLSKIIENNVANNITLVIGGSYGLSSEVLKRSNYALSFSLLTFPHQLFRIMLVEQIYRSFKIINNETYHK